MQHTPRGLISTAVKTAWFYAPIDNRGDDSAAGPPESGEDSIKSPEAQEIAGPDEGNPEMQKTPEPGDNNQGQGQENGQNPNDNMSGAKLTKTPSELGPSDSGKNNPSNSGHDDSQGSDSSDDKGNGDSCGHD